MSQRHFDPSSNNSATGLHLSPSFLSLVFDRYFSVYFRDRQGSKTARRTSTSVPTILSCGPLSYRACVCVLIDVCVQLLYMFRGRQKIILQHSRTKPLDLPIQNADSVRSCSHVIRPHRPYRNTHLTSLTRRILTVHYTNPPSSQLHYPTSSVKKNQESIHFAKMWSKTNNNINSFA